MIATIMKKLTWLILTMSAVCLLFGCQKSMIDDPNTLWVITEPTSTDKMQGQIEKVIKNFQEEHPEITIELEVLPKDGEEREVRLEKLRALIMSGKGPDAFLLPTNSNGRIPLFYDVNQAIHTGIFADVSQYYDADNTIGKDGLNATVMSAGVVDEARFILPLRYDYPVIYADSKLLENSGLDVSAMSKDVNSYLNEIIKSGSGAWLQNASLMKSALLGDFVFFSQVADYKEAEVTLDRDQLKTYLEKQQQLTQLCGETYPGWVGNVLTYLNQLIFLDEAHPFEVATLAQAYEYAAISKVTGQSIEMIPLRTTSGEIIANVTYFAAVGANTSNPEMVYAFLREFLMEESQWEQNRNTSYKYAIGLVGDGWPVRDKGSVEPLWEVCCKIHREPREIIPLLEVELTDDDIPLLNIPIDGVRISNSYVEYEILGSKLAMLNDPVSGVAESVDIDAIADEIISDLEYHLSEG